MPQRYKWLYFNDELKVEAEVEIKVFVNINKISCIQVNFIGVLIFTRKHIAQINVFPEFAPAVPKPKVEEACYKPHHHLGQ